MTQSMRIWKWSYEYTSPEDITALDLREELHRLKEEEGAHHIVCGVLRFGREGVNEHTAEFLYDLYSRRIGISWGGFADWADAFDGVEDALDMWLHDSEEFEALN